MCVCIFVKHLVKLGTGTFEANVKLTPILTHVYKHKHSDILTP